MPNVDPIELAKQISEFTRLPLQRVKGIPGLEDLGPVEILGAYIPAGERIAVADHLSEDEQRAVLVSFHAEATRDKRKAGESVCDWRQAG